MKDSNLNMAEKKRQNSLPVLHVKGTFYEVGYNVGRTFSGLIKTMVDTHGFLNEDYIPAFHTTEGKLIYDETLKNVNKYYPHYVKELEGIADGSGVPFYKLFLLHVDDVLPACVAEIKDNCQGCSTIILNKSSHQIIGHTEDALEEVLTNIYILKAQYNDPPIQENLTAFCYAGLLPGYAMGYNKHGLLFSINIINAKHLGKGKLPRTFVTRALLAADSYEKAIKTLECEGIGIADAMSINLTFLNQQGGRLFYNIEVSPEYQTTLKQSVINVKIVPPGESFFHTNKFIHLKIPETQAELMNSSNARHETHKGYNIVDTKSIQDLLSDITNTTCAIFRDDGRVRTIAVALFDCVKRTWTIYLNKPNVSEPIAIFSLDI